MEENKIKRMTKTQREALVLHIIFELEEDNYFICNIVEEYIIDKYNIGNFSSSKHLHIVFEELYNYIMTIGCLLRGTDYYIGKSWSNSILMITEKEKQQYRLSRMHEFKTILKM